MNTSAVMNAIGSTASWTRSLYEKSALMKATLRSNIAQGMRTSSAVAGSGGPSLMKRMGLAWRMGWKRGGRMSNSTVAPGGGMARGYSGAMTPNLPVLAQRSTLAARAQAGGAPALQRGLATMPSPGSRNWLYDTFVGYNKNEFSHFRQNGPARGVLPWALGYTAADATSVGRGGLHLGRGLARIGAVGAAGYIGTAPFRGRRNR